MNIYELQTRYDSRKSFYGKALVIEDGDTIKLQSYSTIVAKIEEGVLKVYGTYSHTTLRHIKEFIQQFTDYGVLTKGEIEERFF